MKTELKFVFEEDTLETEKKINLINKRTDLVISLQDIGEYVFRPARKHGYSDSRIQELVDRLDELAGPDNPNASDLIGKLEELFYSILEERGINLSELLS